MQFTPHLLPINRGILATAYLPAKAGLTQQEAQEVYADFYAAAPFVRLREAPPSVADVRGTNLCDIFVTLDQRTGLLLVLSVIDNLVKGAAGQAIHNFNLMAGLPETAGLNLVPLKP